MKKLPVIFTFLFIPLLGFSQNSAAFEKAILEGNSEKGFEFIRNMFGVPAIQDPFLHFEEEGISRLSSYCSYRLRKVVATSLIQYRQVKEFWTNYSNEFTAGKWNYRSLYSSDSVAWFAANYSILLIYAHEMGHYMSYRFRAEPNTIYTCEEVLANECLAAFANAFTGNKKLEQHKQLFIRLAGQTAALVPDSAKTPFNLPMDKWCADDPMKDFLTYFETDNTRFLRLYGYSQFKIMEELLLHYTGGSWNTFLNQKFYSHYNALTRKNDFTPLPYRILKSEIINGIYGSNLVHERSTSGNISFYDFYFDDHTRYCINNSGQLFQSSIDKKITGTIKDPNTGEEIVETAAYYLKNLLVNKDSVYWLSRFRYLDSNHNTTPRILSFWENKGLLHYIIWQRTTPDSSLQNFTYTGQTDTLFYHRVVQEGENVHYSSAKLPETITKDSAAITGQVLLAGTNLNTPVIITNRLTSKGQQLTSIWLVDTSTNTPGERVWTGLMQSKGYLFMQNPFVYFDTAGRKISLAFSNSFTERIYMLSIGEKATKGFVLTGNKLSKNYGPQMQVHTLQQVSPGTMYVVAWCRQPGNTTKALTKKMLISWK